jgi:PPM family protein phosphatase
MGSNYYGITDTGRLRDNNEDAFIAQEILKGRYILACVIDGVGGYEGGEIAAAVARDTIIEIMSFPFQDVEKTLRAALWSANDKIFEEKEKADNKHQMACVLTLVVADIANNQLHYAHIGDTRLYLLREESLVKLTKDQSFVGFLEDSGRITEEAAMKHPKRNEINKALGFDPNIRSQEDYFETGFSPFLPGDTLLLCSDGLTDMVNSALITSTLSNGSSIEEKGKALIDAANAAGGKDNVTVVLVQNGKEKLQHKITKPAAKKKEIIYTAEEKTYIPHPSESVDPVPEKRSPGKGSRNAIILLSVFSVGLLATVLWQLNNKGNKDESANVFIAPKPRTVQEQQLQDSIGSSAASIIIDRASFPRLVTITDTFIIQKDSFHLNGNGLVIQCDSPFRGPAFLLPATTKYVLLENIDLEGFPLAIIAASNSLHLRNVRFLDCEIPVQYNFMLSQSRYIHGDISDILLFRSDSLPVNQTAWK